MYTFTINIYTHDELIVTIEGGHKMYGMTGSIIALECWNSVDKIRVRILLLPFRGFDNQ